MQRVQKFLADLGYGSRRQIESWIISQRLKINSHIVKLGEKVFGKEEFSLDNKILITNRSFPNKNLDFHSLKRKYGTSSIILYHKPVGKICSRSDPNNRPTVFADLPKLQFKRWVAVGRLDLNTSGLLLFTDNGDLANKLMHPNYNQEREYIVRVFGQAAPQLLSLLTSGVKLEDGMAKFKKITCIKQNKCNTWYKVVLTEGKNRLIKRIFASQGLLVNRLIRIRFGDLSLPKELPAGQFSYLESSNNFV